MNRLEIRVSRRWTVLYALGMVTLAIVGIWLISSGRDPLYGWGLAIVGPLGALGFVLRAFDRDPYIIISDEGVQAFGAGGQPIPWSEINTAYCETDTRNRETVYIDLVDPASFPHRYPELGKWMIRDKIPFNGEGYELSGDDIADAIVRKQKGLAFTPEQRALVAQAE